LSISNVGEWGLTSQSTYHSLYQRKSFQSITLMVLTTTDPSRENTRDKQKKYTQQESK